MSPLNSAMFLKVEQSYEYRKEVMRRQKVWEYHLEILETLAKGNIEESMRMIDYHYVGTGERIWRCEKQREKMISDRKIK